MCGSSHILLSVATIANSYIVCEFCHLKWYYSIYDFFSPGSLNRNFYSKDLIIPSLQFANFSTTISFYQIQVTLANYLFYTYFCVKNVHQNVLATANRLHLIITPHICRNRNAELLYSDEAF